MHSSTGRSDVFKFAGAVGNNYQHEPAVQRHVDLSLSKTTAVAEGVSVELRWEVFNALNQVNFALPANDLQDGSDLTTVQNTVDGPRTMQLGLKLVF
ncbi:MAG: hypothetical protein ACR2L2_19500 [Acidobacteriota bacterium]